LAGPGDKNITIKTPEENTREPGFSDLNLDAISCTGN
jgi:hypothetical protein